MKKVWILFLLLLLLPVIASAQQFDFGNGPQKTPSSRPWDEFKLPKKNVKLIFKNSSASAVIDFFQTQSGITIVKDPALTGQIELTTPKEIPLSDAFLVLQKTLDLKGFDMSKDGNLLVIKKKDVKNQGRSNGFDWTQFTQPQQQEESILKVYVIKYANASQVARVVNDVFSGAPQQNNNPFAAFQRGGQQRGGQGGRGGFNPAQFFGGGAQQTTPNVRASSDDYSNTVIVNAPANDQKQVLSLISEIDKPAEDPQVTRVFPLQYANATDAAPVIQNVLVSNAPRGKGGVGQQNVDPGQRFQQALRFGSAQASFGQVVADTRSNSLVVTATPDNLDTIKKVIDELDKPIDFENTTFVFPLSNARADDVAALLNSAFGQRQGTNGRNNAGGNNQNRNNNNNQNRNNTQNRNNGGGGGQRGGDLIDPTKEMALDVDPDGELMTNIGVAQGFGGFGGGGQRNNNNQAQTTGRDENGRVVNIRDLSGQVTAIPDLNTNSIIVVATPENADVIRQILDQLDKIPEQVMIETIIVEATLDSTDKLGVEWNLIQNNVFRAAGNTGTASQGFGIAGSSAVDDQQGFKYTLAGGALSGVLHALQSDSKFKVLSTPRIFTSNNVQAEINISQRVPYITSTRQDTTGAFTYSYSFQDVGIILTVQPRITANGYVAMDVTQTANELQGFTDFNAPIINTREANTTVSVKDGETIILGGIIRNTVTASVKKIPLLGDIPILGQLFRSNSKTEGKTELLVFLTPRVVRNDEEARKMRESGQNEMSPETQKDLQKLIKPTETKTGTTPPAKTTGGGNKNGGQ